MTNFLLHRLHKFPNFYLNCGYIILLYFPVPEGRVEPSIEEWVVAGGGHGHHVAQEEGHVVHGPAGWVAEGNRGKQRISSHL